MKATIRKADGTTIETEGTPEEIAKVAGVPATQYVYLPAQPCTLPHYPATWPLYPQQPFYPAWMGTVRLNACAGNAGATFFLTNGVPNA